MGLVGFILLEIVELLVLVYPYIFSTVGYCDHYFSNKISLTLSLLFFWGPCNALIGIMVSHKSLRLRNFPQSFFFLFLWFNISNDLSASFPISLSSWSSYFFNFLTVFFSSNISIWFSFVTSMSLLIFSFCSRSLSWFHLVCCVLSLAHWAYLKQLF